MISFPMLFVIPSVFLRLYKTSWTTHFKVTVHLSLTYLGHYPKIFTRYSLCICRQFYFLLRNVSTFLLLEVLKYIQSRTKMYIITIRRVRNVIHRFCFYNWRIKVTSVLNVRLLSILSPVLCFTSVLWNHIVIEGSTVKIIISAWK